LFLLGLFWATDLPDIDYFNRLGRFWNTAKGFATRRRT
jgi:hypothetical protein